MSDINQAANQPVVGNTQGASEPSVPAWVDNKAAPAAPPAAPATNNPPPADLNNPEPQTYQPQNKKNKKMINFIGMGLLVLVLSSLTFGGLSFLDKSADNQLQEKSSYPSPSPSQYIIEEPPELPAEPIFTKKGDFALSVNGQILSWQEYEDFLNYKLKRLKENVNDQQTREDINNYLIEGFLLADTVKQIGTSLTTEEFNQAGTSLFGSSLDQELQNYSSARRLIETYGYKQIIIENLVSWKTGGSMVVEVGGPRAQAVADKKGMNVKDLAQQLIQPYYQQIQAGRSVRDLLTQAEKDQELIAFNGSSQIDFVEKYIKDDPNQTIPWEDSNFYDIFFSLNAGETSDLFILKHPNNLQADSWTDYGYAFIKIDESFKGQFDSYKDWLSAATKGATIISNL